MSNFNQNNPQASQYDERQRQQNSGFNKPTTATPGQNNYNNPSQGQKQGQYQDQRKDKNKK